ncbi:hypothetical protein SEA_COMRADE_70 [Streptomyces phage Comrade]|uniref:Uncharacterized protein n=3 Tax=Gilsonvirus comrade TaxID=2846395 RepID=A0A345ME01_9CAUD|nr:hypothetical protein HWB84_gp176 [Streptomyces phage Comrade]AXH68782.1 hypothetical protein SEA_SPARKLEGODDESS_70 [Streptomyces phage SparkleGoddess]QQO39757.1 hypothetical protein SEA_BELFORT_72 [Streptomyces phage Belfort]QZE11665.1 hypothetical protein SEA_KARP_68 [Streptomyces phage Karp]UTN92324.1 hypothetical protein SEA_STIGMA_69 [Streptomyces phage Stigma]AXQ63340.1 hypothetical protein SEA_COMRADE_70 [Streptomyces phage Comrade]
MSDENPLETVSVITEFNDLTEFMQDDQLDRALELAIRCIAQPDVAAVKAPKLIVELQAISFKFAVKAVEYATIKKDRAGTDNNHRKNVYYSTKEALDRLVDALKYAARA